MPSSEAALICGIINKSVSVPWKNNVLAAFFVKSIGSKCEKANAANVRLVSVGIGRKCLNAAEFTPADKKRLVVDGHAEILARRAFLR